MSKENLVLTLEGKILYHTTETPSKRIVYAVGIDSEDGEVENISVHAQNVSTGELESMVEGVLELYVETLRRTYNLPPFWLVQFISERLGSISANSINKVFSEPESNDEE